MLCLAIILIIVSSRTIAQGNCPNLFAPGVDIASVSMMSNVFTNPLIELKIDRISGDDCVSVDPTQGVTMEIEGLCDPIIVGFSDGESAQPLTSISRRGNIVRAFAFCTELDQSESALQVSRLTPRQEIQLNNVSFINPRQAPERLRTVLQNLADGECTNQTGAPIGYGDIRAQLAVLSAYADPPDALFARLWREQHQLWYGAFFADVYCLLGEPPPTVEASLTLPPDEQSGITPKTITLTNVIENAPFATDIVLTAVRQTAGMIIPVPLESLTIAPVNNLPPNFEPITLTLTEPGTYIFTLTVEGTPLSNEGDAVVARKTTATVSVMVEPPPTATPAPNIDTTPTLEPTPSATPLMVWEQSYDLPIIDPPLPLWQIIFGTGALMAIGGIAVGLLAGGASAVGSGIHILAAEVQRVRWRIISVLALIAFLLIAIAVIIDQTLLR